MIAKILICIVLILLDLIALSDLIRMLCGKNQESSDFRIRSYKLDLSLIHI